MSPAFLVTSLVVVLLPGPGVLYTLAVALGRGWRASVAAVLGCTLGIVPQGLAAVLGLTALLAASETAFTIVRSMGALWLVYMAVGMLREHGDTGGIALSPRRSPASALRLIGDGIALNVFNPKLALFFLAFLPQFVPAGPGAALDMLGLVFVFMAMTFAVFVAYGAAAAAARRHVLERPSVMRWMRWGFAGCFVALGLRLALSPR